MPFIIVCIALAISAVYELLEWAVAAMSGEDGDSFLGTQGYVWDTQSDMLFATIGVVTALITLSGIHNKQLSRCKKQNANFWSLQAILKTKLVGRLVLCKVF